MNPVLKAGCAVIALAMGVAPVQSQQFPHEEELEGERIIHFWDRDINGWKAYSYTQGNFLKIKPEWKAQWDETTRGVVLEILTRVRNNEVRRKIEGVSPKLSKLAEAAMKAAKPDEIQIVCYEFLAFARNPEDRSLIEKLVEPNGWPRELLGARDDLKRDMVRVGKTRRGDLLVENIDDYRRLGDYLLGVFEGKKGIEGRKPEDPAALRAQRQYMLSGIAPTSASLRATGLRALAEHVQERSGRHYLGEVRGTVELPVAIPQRAGWLRLFLSPEKLMGPKVNDINAEAIEVELGPAVKNFPNWVDKVDFVFGTVMPGKYRLKAIWDKRPSYSDKTGAGPGDYESAWSSVIEVGKGASIAGLTVHCTNRVSGGEAYYKADEFAERQRRERKALFWP